MSDKNLSDIQIINKYLDKSKNRCFEIIYLRHVDKVYRFLYSRSGDRFISEDVTSETFSVFYELIGKYNGESKLETFLIGIALNKLREYYRNNRYKSELIEDVVFLEDYEESSFQPEDYRIMRKILNQLSNKYKKILELRFIKNWEHKRIAEHLGISEENSRQLTSRSLKKAQNLLSKEKNEKRK